MKAESFLCCVKSLNGEQESNFNTYFYIYLCSIRISVYGVRGYASFMTDLSIILCRNLFVRTAYSIFVFELFLP